MAPAPKVSPPLLKRSKARVATAAEVAESPNSSSSSPPPLPVGAHAEVAGCDDYQEGEWDGVWEECTIVANHGATCDVRITSDGMRCNNMQWRHVRPCGRATYFERAHERLRAGSRAEVAGCDDDHEGEWDGVWEECMVVADNGATCDVRILEDGELCEGVPRRYIRPLAVAAGLTIGENVEVEACVWRPGTHILKRGLVSYGLSGAARDGADSCSWEECTLLAYNDATCNVRVLSDDQECIGVPLAHVRLPCAAAAFSPRPATPLPRVSSGWRAIARPRT